MPRTWREWLVLACGALVLVAVNAGILGRERHLAEGRVVLLELAPVDPRSLMQGDYMALRFKAETEAFARDPAKDGENGRLVVTLDARGVGSFVRRDDGAPLADGEVALKYRVRAGNVKFATNAYFFREGTGATYEAARYGEFRVDKTGELLLARLRGKNLEALGPR